MIRTNAFEREIYFTPIFWMGYDTRTRSFVRLVTVIALDFTDAVPNIMKRQGIKFTAHAKHTPLVKKE